MSDEIVWQIINQSYCSFKIKTKTSNFCRNEYNVTGFCNRQSCPLANQRYATVRSDGPKGILYLYIKTAERAHLPSKLYEKIKLSSNYAEALKQIDSRLQFWPKFLIHKCKQRLTRLVQVAMRTRKLAAEEERLGERLVPKLAPKIRHREAARERKAEVAAKLERSIERELIERLRQGAYGDQPLNVSQGIWEKVLRGLEREGAAVRDKDMDEGVEDEEEEDEAEEELEEEEESVVKLDGAVEYISASDFDESDEELADMEDWLGSEEDDDREDDGEEDSEEETTKHKAKVGDKRKRARVIRSKGRKRKEIETEEESRQKLLAF